MPAPANGHRYMVATSQKRFAETFKVIKTEKEYIINPSIICNNLVTGKRVDLLIWFVYGTKIYRVPLEIETQELNVRQIKNNIRKCVDFFGAVIVICKTGMVDKVNNLLRAMPTRYRNNAFIIGYSSIIDATTESRELILSVVVKLIDKLKLVDGEFSE